MNLNKVIFRFVSISFSILVTLLVVVGLVELGTYGYQFGYRVFTEKPVSSEPGRDVVVQITSDMSEHEIASMLEEKGLVRDGSLYFVQLKLSAYSGKLLPGIYTLNTAMTGREMSAVMAAAPEEDTEETEAEEAGTQQQETEGTEGAEETP